MKSKMDSIQFNTNMDERYPELHTYIHSEEQKEQKKQRPVYRLAIVDFMDKHNLPRNYSYDLVWDYIVANEDKHEWWML